MSKCVGHAGTHRERDVDEDEHLVGGAEPPGAGHGGRVRVGQRSVTSCWRGHVRGGRAGAGATCRAVSVAPAKALIGRARGLRPAPHPPRPSRPAPQARAPSPREAPASSRCALCAPASARAPGRIPYSTTSLGFWSFVFDMIKLFNLLIYKYVFKLQLNLALYFYVPAVKIKQSTKYTNDMEFIC